MKRENRMHRQMIAMEWRARKLKMAIWKEQAFLLHRTLQNSVGKP
jgi:hypothetical protein